MGIRSHQHDDLIGLLIDAAMSYRTSRSHPKSTRAILDKGNIDTYKGELYRRLPPPESNHHFRVEGVVLAVLLEKDPSDHVNELLRLLSEVSVRAPERQFAKA